jgi:hypothetical protein
MTLHVKFPNNEVFQIPIDVIANDRTKYYSKIDGFKEGSLEWQEEYKLSLVPGEVFDWVQNNMDWEDVKQYAVKMDVPIVTDYDKMWHGASFDIN